MASFPGLARVRQLLSASRSPVSGPDDVLRGVGSAILGATLVDPATPPDRLEFVELAGLDDYAEHLRSSAAAHRGRAVLERLLSVRQKPFGCLGYDACVDRVVAFEVDFDYATVRDEHGLLLPNYRERLVSPATGLNSRQRATVLALRHLLAGRDPSALALYATEAVTPLFRWLQREYPAMVGSEYFGEALPLGEARDGVRNEDVTRLTFGYGSFDVVISCDVLEHVPAYEQGLRELRRVLRPGGLLLMTVPFLADRRDHLVRARVSSEGAVEHLAPPELHGDPVNAEAGILCFQTFGWNLLEDLRRAGFASARALLVWSYFHGIMGGNQILFHASA